jgi:hypothetical protein
MAGRVVSDMASNDSVEFYLRFLGERFSAFRESLGALIEALALEDRKKKVEAANVVLARLDDLRRAMSKSDHPGWIQPLEEQITGYLRAHERNAQAGRRLFEAILRVNPAIESQKWEFPDQSALAIDFVGIYQECYLASNAPQLFDDLIEQVKALVESGELDSLQTIRSLEKLIATVRKNARGDYFASQGTWEFTLAFFTNLSIETIESIPGLKQISKALRKTLADLDVEMLQVHGKIRERLKQSAYGDFPMLDYKSRRVLPKAVATEAQTGPSSADSSSTETSSSRGMR